MSSNPIVRLDCRGVSRPGPILRLALAVDELDGDAGIIEILADADGFVRDLEAWCVSTPVQILSTRKRGREVWARLAIGGPAEATDPRLVAKLFDGEPTAPTGHVYEEVTEEGPRQKDSRGDALAAAVIADETVTQLAHIDVVDPVKAGLAVLVVTRDDDRSLRAALFLASDAAAQGLKTLVFCTFEGVRCLRADRIAAARRRPNATPTPRAEAGLDELLHRAEKLGVMIVVCQTSLAMSGLSEQDLAEMSNLRSGSTLDLLGAAAEARVVLSV